MKIHTTLNSEESVIIAVFRMVLHTYMYTKMFAKYRVSILLKVEIEIVQHACFAFHLDSSNTKPKNIHNCSLVS